MYVRHPLGASGQQENMLEFRIEVQARHVSFGASSVINGTFREVQWAEGSEEVKI